MSGLQDAGWAFDDVPPPPDDLAPADMTEGLPPDPGPGQPPVPTPEMPAVVDARPARRRNAGSAGTGAFVSVDKLAEEAVLAAILTAPRCFDDVRDVLDPEDFGTPAFQHIYRAVRSCDLSSVPFDRITVAAELARVGARGYERALEDLCSGSVDTGNVVAHANIVAEKALIRRIVEASRAIAGTALTPGMNPIDALAQAESTVFGLGRKQSQSSLVDMRVAVPEMLEALKASRGRQMLGVSTGFRDLDKLTAGLQPGQMITLAARPAMGKSALALQFAWNIANATGKLVPFFSYEMGRPELMLRLLSNVMAYDTRRLRDAVISPEVSAALARAADELAASSLLIDDQPPQTIGAVRSWLRRLARRGELGAVVIDYLQLMSGDRLRRDASRTEEISEISRGLKMAGVELGIPVIALSQLNRGLESRPNKRPMLSDLRESGAIEQDSNICLFVYRDAIYNPQTNETEAELIVAKNRGGETGTVLLDFYGSQGARFVTTDRKPAPSLAPPPSGPGAAPGGGGFGGGSPFGGGGGGFGGKKNPF